MYRERSFALSCVQAQDLLRLPHPHPQQSVEHGSQQGSDDVPPVGEPSPVGRLFVRGLYSFDPPCSSKCTRARTASVAHAHAHVHYKSRFVLVLAPLTSAAAAEQVFSDVWGNATLTQLMFLRLYLCMRCFRDRADIFRSRRDVVVAIYKDVRYTK